MLRVQIVLFAMAALSAQSVFASGSLDYICVADKTGVRYEYHEGEEISANVYTAVGVSKKEIVEAILKENSLTLDAFQVARALIHGWDIAVDGCNKQYFNDAKEYAKCMSGKNAADVVNKDTAEKDRDGGSKYRHVVQTATGKNGLKLVLDIRNNSESYEGEYYGKLTVTAKGRTALTGVHQVTCMISTP